MTMIKFITESGTNYTIDTERKQWYRPSNANSMSITTSGGEYVRVSPVQIGKRVTIVCPPRYAEFEAYVVTTSKVVKID